MPQLRTSLGTAGAAVLLVVAAFSAGVSSAPSAQLQAESTSESAGSDIADSDTSETSDEATREQFADDIAPLAITSSPELLYVPVTPCRVVNTRNSAAGAMGNTSRNFYIGGTFGFTAQGGTAGGCGIPTGAKAVVVTILALDPSRSGRLKAWPAGQAEPTAATLYYGSTTTSTGQTLTLRSGAGTDVTVRNFTATTDVVIDVTGYYVPQMHAYLASGGTIIDQSGRVVSSTKTGTGNYTVVFDRDISTCTGVASSDLTGHIMSVYTSGSNAYVYIVNNAGTPTDYWVNLSIHC